MEDLEKWREQQIKMAQENPEQFKGQLRSVLGDEVYAHVFGEKPSEGGGESKAPEMPKPGNEPQYNPDGTVILDAIEKITSLPKAVDKAVQTLGSVPFKDEVRQIVMDELEKLPAAERVKVTPDDVIAYTRMLAGLKALQVMSGEGEEPKAERPPRKEETSESKGDSEEPVVPEYMKGPRDVIMQMKDALLEQGFTEKEIEAMCQ